MPKVTHLFKKAASENDTENAFVTTGPSDWFHVFAFNEAARLVNCVVSLMTITAHLDFVLGNTLIV